MTMDEKEGRKIPEARSFEARFLEASAGLR